MMSVVCLEGIQPPPRCRNGVRCMFAGHSATLSAFGLSVVRRSRGQSVILAVRIVSVVCLEGIQPLSVPLWCPLCVSLEHSAPIGFLMVFAVWTYKEHLAPLGVGMVFAGCLRGIQPLAESVWCPKYVSLEGIQSQLGVRMVCVVVIEGPQSPSLSLSYYGVRCMSWGILPFSGPQWCSMYV